MSNRERGRPPIDDILTPAEWRVLHAAQHGMSKRVIAKRLQVSQDAIKYHLRNIRDKLGVESKAELANYLVMPRGVRMNERNATQSGESASGMIGQIARTVRNLEQSANWFEVILELPLLYRFDDMAFFDCSGTRLMLSTLSPFNDSESVLYFRVPDIRTSFEALKVKGVDFINSPHRIHTHDDGTEEWMAFFCDPDDRPLALMSSARRD